jgi:hypothetical protein
MTDFFLSRFIKGHLLFWPVFLLKYFPDVFKISISSKHAGTLRMRIALGDLFTVWLSAKLSYVILFYETL